MATALLRMGASGSGVRELQTRLRAFDQRLHVDGVFGPRTERATRLAQRRLGAYPADGIVGPITKRALELHGPVTSNAGV